MPPSVTRAQFPRGTSNRGIAEPLATEVPLGDTWLGSRHGAEVTGAAAAPIASLISSGPETERFLISCIIRQANHQLPAPATRRAEGRLLGHADEAH